MTERAQMTHTHVSAGARPSVGRSDEQILQRWRDLREMLIRQLEMFETGGLTLRSNAGDVSLSAVADLRTNILAFDALISGLPAPEPREAADAHQDRV